MGKLIDLTGDKFSRLKVLSQHGRIKGNGNIKWLCQCDCGNTVNVDSRSLRTNRTRSCGCLHIERLKERGKDILNENNSQWRGDNVGRIGAHDSVRNNKIKPHLCQKCGERPARELSYNHILGRWTRDPEDYEYLCRSCHRLKDIGNGAKPITKNRIYEIRNLYDLGSYSQRKLATLFKISQTTIWAIIRYKGAYAN